MSARQFAAAVLIELALGWLVPLWWLVSDHFDEVDRRSWAAARRRCALLISVAPTGKDSLSVLQGTARIPGCATALTTDTLAPADR